MKTLIKIISSGLYVGYAPIASGTLASIWGILIYLGLGQYPIIYIIVTMLLFIAGFLVSGKAEEIFNEKDSHKIVIDEIASMCLVYAFLRPTGWPMIIAGFLLFRIFDIIKPPPGRKVQALAGSKGVMLDDVVAAIYTIVILMVYSALQK